MRKFFGGLLAVIASLCLVAAFDLWVVRGIVSPEMIDEIADEVLASPEARSAVGREVLERVREDPERVTVLEAAFGNQWGSTTREIAELAVQTPEFESEFRRAVDQGKEVAFGDETVITVNGTSSIRAVESELDPSVAEAIPLLPARVFNVSEKIDSEDLRTAVDARNNSRVPMVLLVLAGLAALVAGVFLYGAIGPVLIASVVAGVISILQWLAARSIREEILAEEAGSVLKGLVADVVTGRIVRSTVILIVLAWLPLVLHLLYTVLRKATGGGNGSPGPKAGSDTDWIESPASQL